LPSGLGGVCGALPGRSETAQESFQSWAVLGAVIILMSFDENSGLRRRWALRATCLFLIAVYSIGAYDFAKPANRVSHLTAARTRATFAAAPVPSAPIRQFQVKNYLLDFAGDHSLNAATVIEQSVAGYANYTVQLRLASGAEQSVVVAAPPGGLQIEMQDMTGDHVPNDVVLRPALLRWPPTVLVNDGHDHFSIVVSGADPGNFSSRENLGSRPRYAQTFAFLRSSGFKSIQLPHSERTLVPRLHQTLVSTFTQSFAWGMEHAASSDRAPPLFTL
jgi:hypothetical protein